MYIPRLIEETILSALTTRKVLFLLGARQVGKTTVIEHLLQSLQGDLLNMDIDIDRARLIAASKLSPLDGIRSLCKGNILVIDEAQRVPTIGQICKGWYDARVPVKIILLGSASMTLLDTAAADLTGRNEKVWLTPLLFQEVLTQQPWFDTKQSTTHIQEHFAEQLESMLLQRLVFGSYPEAYTDRDPRQYLTNLTNDYLLKDIFTASLVRSPDDVRRLLQELARSLGTTISVASIATRLGLSRQTVTRYLQLLEGIFVIFSIPAFATDPMKEINKSYKYYFWDTGVKNALQREWVIAPTRSDISILWENWVMAEIMKQSRTFQRQEELFFWESRNGSHVDLVVKQGSQLHPFMITFHPQDHKTSKSFERTYGVRPQGIHPATILNVLL